MHVMIDLETLSLSPRATVTQIAVVRFDPRPDGVIVEADAFNHHVKIEGQGRQIDPSTVLWWFGQSDAARARFVEGQKTARPLADVMNELAWWWTRAPIVGVWAHGAAFDIPILEDVCTQLGRTSPWSYKLVRDTRTLYHVLNEDRIPKVEQTGIAHDALADALTQCRQVQACRVAFLQREAQTVAASVAVQRGGL